MSDPSRHRPGNYRPIRTDHLITDLRQQAAEWADQGCVHTAHILRISAAEIEEMVAALKQCRRYLMRGGVVDPDELKQQIDDALAMPELREANAIADEESTK